MTERLELLVKVEAERATSASRQAQALERVLLDEGIRADIRRIRSDRSFMDGGSTLVIVLASSPVLLELAKALRVFLNRHKSSEITITDANGTLIAKNISSQNVAGLFAAWRGGISGE